MTRVPKSKTRNKKKALAEQVFAAHPGPRRRAGWLCVVLAVMFAIHQTQVEGIAPLIRIFALTAMALFAVLAFYFLRRGARRGTLIRVGPDGFGLAIGFSGWIEVPWEKAKAYKYWEPTGLAWLIKRRQTRWVGIALADESLIADLPPSQRFEIFLNTFHGRPPLCVLHPFVDADLLEVLQAFKDHAPKELDDYKGEIIK